MTSPALCCLKDSTGRPHTRDDLRSRARGVSLVKSWPIGQTTVGGTVPFPKQHKAALEITIPGRYNEAGQFFMNGGA